MAEKDKKEKSEAIRKAKKKIIEATNKVKKLHNRQGIDARNLMRENKRLWEEQVRTTGYGDIELLVVLHQPDKTPTIEEAAALNPPQSLLEAWRDARVRAGLLIAG
jgi:hypothetical protein